MTSQRPLFDEEGAVAALGDGGRYGAYERAEDGRYERKETIQIERKSRAYDFISENGHSNRATFHPLRAATYVAQMNYFLLHITSGETFLHALDCSKQDSSKLIALRVEVRDRKATR
jgi:hypothetical protein